MLKIGVIGIGNGGSQVAKLAKEKLNVTALAINSSEDDLKTVYENINTLQIGNGAGTGKNRQLSKEFFKSSYDKVINSKDVEELIKGLDVIYVVTTTGGGTGGGTSPLFTALMIDKFKKANVDTKIVLMTIMPTIKEGNSAQDNTQLFYRELFNTMPDLTYMVYDNNKFVNDYGPAALLNEVNLDIVDDIAILSGAYQFTTQYDSIDKQESIILNSTPGRLAVLKLYDIKEKDLDNLTLDDLLLSGMDKCSLADLQRDRDIVSRGVISNLNESLTKKFNFNMPKITEVLGEPIESFQHVYVNTEAGEPNNLFVILGGLSAPNDRLQKTLERAAEIREMHEAKSKKPNIFDDHDISGSNSLRQKALNPDTFDDGKTSDDDIFSRFGV
jgi:putative cell division GTPase ftsZ, diverged